ncbi:MAG TPA: D-aminoacyl-tRNA deacylase [Acidimicrobiales bacterium]|nr:D-aminoacyl-tRNA deacylase [Acidimicrobiales bacterium]
MRALVQRVASARVTVEDEVVGAIGPGLCTLVGVTHDDDAGIARRMGSRLWTLRAFADAEGMTNLSAQDLGLEMMVVSQFTLYADTSKGRRPSFVDAARPDQAEPLVAAVVATLADLGARVATGRFGASMQLALINDGPFTLVLEEPAR